MDTAFHEHGDPFLRSCDCTVYGADVLPGKFTEKFSGKTGWHPPTLGIRTERI